MSLIMAEVVGRTGETVRIAASDASKDLFVNGGMDLYNPAGKSITSALITVEENSIRVSFGTPATQTPGAGIGHELGIGMSFLVVGFENLQNLRFINYGAAQNGVLMI